MNNRLYAGIELAAAARCIDRLLVSFPQESLPFFQSLENAERKQLKRYLNWRKAENQDNWTFNEQTYRTVAAIDRRAAQYYEDKLHYQQLELQLQYVFSRD